MSLALLAGCHHGQKSPDKNFTKALNAYFSNHNECLYPQTVRFPYEVNIKSAPGAGPTVAQLDALTKAGLLTSKEEKDLKIKRYALTPVGEKATARFCYGHREVTSIDGSVPAANVDGRHAMAVSYHYKMMDVPVWASSPEVERAFPSMANTLSDQAQDKTTLALTMAGWQVPD